jgi:Mn2+/Fe2+ NRAMP family transporter
MIYKRFGNWWGRFSLFDLQLVNFFTLVTEFAAISLVSSKLGISPYIAVPLAALLLTILVVTGGYLQWEHIVSALCLLDTTWIVLAFRAGPNFGEAVHDAFLPNVPPGGVTGSLIFLIIAIVGTTVAPWQLFFQQSCIVDKKLRFQDLNSERLDTFVSAIFTILVAACMMLVGNILRQHHIPYEDPAQMAVAIGPIHGNWMRNIILLLIVNAAVLGTTSVSLSSSWAYAEVMGWPHSLHRKLGEAPGFYAVYVSAVALAAAIVLIPKAPLQAIILGVQVLAGLMLPSALVFLQLLLNDRELLGENANTVWNNWINWIIIALLFILSGILAAQVMLPERFPKT